MADNRKECCKVEDNLIPEKIDHPDPNLTMRRCKVCKCRHFELGLDIVKLGLVGAPIGQN